MHLANFKSDLSALLCANAAGMPPARSGTQRQPPAYLRRTAAAVAVAAAAAAAILLCFRLLTSGTTDYS